MEQVTSGLTVFGRLNSVNVQKVAWTAHELGINYHRIDAGAPYDLNKENPKFLELNPNGLVPTIVDDGFVLFESNSIVRYLAEKHHTKEGVQLFSSDLKERALANQWMDWQFTVGADMKIVFWGLVRTPEEKRNMKEIQEAAARAYSQWKVLDEQLAKTPFVAGQHLSMGDIPAGSLVHRWIVLNDQYKFAPDLVHLRKWYDSLREREGYKLFIAKELN